MKAQPVLAVLREEAWERSFNHLSAPQQRGVNNGAFVPEMTEVCSPDDQSRPYI